MRAFGTLLLALLFVAPSVADDTETIALKELNFELKNPDTLNWELGEITAEQKKAGLHVHLVTEWADSDPPAGAHVYVYANSLTKRQAKWDAEKIRGVWKDQIETVIENKTYLKQEKGKIGGVDCYEADLKGTHSIYGGTYRMAYIIFINGSLLYQMYIHRSYDAVDDEDLDAEIKAIRDSFKFYEIKKTKADKNAKDEGPAAPEGGGGADQADIDPEKLERKEHTINFWKVKLIKPKGMVEVPAEKFDKSEQANSCIFKAEAIKGQTRCMIRAYAKSLKSKSGIYSLDKLAQSSIKSFEKVYKKSARKKPEIDRKWKCKLAKKSFSVKLVGRRTTTEVTWWYLAECKNNRQYRIQIYVTGATGITVWKNPIEDFMKNFEPTK